MSSHRDPRPRRRGQVQPRQCSHRPGQELPEPKRRTEVFHCQLLCRLPKWPIVIFMTRLCYYFATPEQQRRGDEDLLRGRGSLHRELQPGQHHGGGHARLRGQHRGGGGGHRAAGSVRKLGHIIEITLTFSLLRYLRDEGRL